MAFSFLIRAALISVVSSSMLWAQTPIADTNSGAAPVAPAAPTDPNAMAPLPHLPLDHMPDSVGKTTPIPVKNGSFENGLDGWTIQSGSPAVFTVTEEAASMGAKGLSVKGDPTTKAYLASDPIPVTPGHIYGAQLWGRGRTGVVTAIMEFFGADDKTIGQVRIKGSSFGATFLAKGHFENGDMRAIAPEGATYMRFVIGTEKGSTADIDDLQVWELSMPGTPLFEDVTALKAEVAANPSRGLPLPKIVIKLDDMVKKVHSWDNVLAFMKSKGDLKVNYGIICNSLENGAPEYYQWIKDMNATGEVEFWNHGYDHGANLVDGVMVQEFKQPYDYQKKHFDDAQRLAVEKLGFPLTCFGAPFNATNEDTVKVVAAAPEIKVWMYGDPKNTGGKVVLDRLGCVNLENPTFIPDFEKFLAGYAHNRGYPYYCMQGHPNQWDDARWVNFQEIVSFLAEQKAPFVKASELTAKDVIIPGFETLNAPATDVTPAAQ